VPVHPGTKEGHEIGPVPPGQCLQPPGELELGFGFGQVEPAGAQLRRDVGEELVDRIEPERRQHPLAIAVGVGSVRHGRQPAAISAS
jgi:hypothetical protein